jgi:hypothetical protein
VTVRGGAVIAVLALLACAGIVLTTSWTAVRDVAIVLAVGLLIRAAARYRERKYAITPA